MHFPFRWKVSCCLNTGINSQLSQFCRVKTHPTLGCVTITEDVTLSSVERRTHHTNEAQRELAI